MSTTDRTSAATTDPLLDPARCALLVMDYQVGIVDRIVGADALVGRVGDLVADARERGAHVGWVRVGFTDADVAAIPPTSVMAAHATPERRAAMHADAPATQVDARLTPRPHDAQVRKTRVGAFTTTDLDAQLRERGVTTLLLAGLSTSGVVLSTVREAMDRDYRVVVVADGCADPDGEVHDFLVTRLFPRYADVVDAGGWSSLWR